MERLVEDRKHVRVVLQQLVMGSDEGQEETVTEVITLDKVEHGVTAMSSAGHALVELPAPEPGDLRHQPVLEPTRRLS